MDLISRFKKDYLNYLVSTIIPVIINAGSIPLFKHLLGAEGYGKFSITFNAVLLCTAILSGWIWQSIIRYFNTSINKKIFARQSILLSCITQAIFILPVFCLVWYINGDVLIATFFAITLFITSLQFSLLAISQSVFLSKKSIYFELIRSVTYLSSALILLKYSGINFMYTLFTALIISYTLSFSYLYRQTNIKLLVESNDESGSEDLKSLFSRFIIYGWPLSLWFVFSFLISVVDKYFMLKNISAQAQGNYQAMFDFLSKSITVLITPVIISLFPLLTTAYQKGENKEIRKLLKTILGFEFAGLVIAIISYWTFGANILFSLIKTPNTPAYKLMGVFIITGTFIWQMAIVIQKRYELEFKNNFLLAMVAIAFMSQLMLYLLLGNTKNPLLYPIGFMLSSVLYLCMVSFSTIKNYLLQFSKNKRGL
jgi:O-antigen/teichoic acid export membrane protein